MYYVAFTNNRKTSRSCLQPSCCLAPARGKDRRCVYEDGDREDLSVAELKTLAKLDPLNKPRSISPKPSDSVSRNTETTSFRDSKQVAASVVSRNVKRHSLSRSESVVGESSKAMTLDVKSAGYQLDPKIRDDDSPPETVRKSGRELTANIKLADYHVEEPSAMRKSLSDRNIKKLSTDTKDHHLQGPNTIANESRESTVNDKQSCHRLEETKTKDDNQKPVTIRKSVRDRKPTRTIEETLIAEHQQKQADSCKRAATSTRPTVATKIRKLLSSLDDDDVPVDRAAESTIGQPTDEDACDNIDDESELENPNEWLEKVASQLGAAATSQQKNRLRPMSRNSAVSSDSPSLARNSQCKIAKPDMASLCSTISFSSGNDNPKVPASVLIAHPSVPVSSTSAVHTLIDVDRGSRHDCLVFDRDNPKRVVGEVIVEGTMGWVEVRSSQDI